MRNAKKLEYGFSNEEFEIRLQRAQELLYENKLDALLITIPSNLRYFTGIDTNFWESPTRPWFLVIPLSGSPIAVIPEIGEKLFKKTFVNKEYTPSSMDKKFQFSVQGLDICYFLLRSVVFLKNVGSF